MATRVFNKKILDEDVARGFLSRRANRLLKSGPVRFNIKGAGQDSNQQDHVLRTGSRVCFL